MKHTTSIKTGLVAIAISAIVGLLAAPSLIAEAGAPPDGPAGWARFGHFAPTADPVDITVDGMPFAEGIGFKEVSEYVPLPAGDHRFELRLSAQPASAPVLVIDAAVPPAGSITVAAVSTADGITGQVFDDALTAPPAGQALVRFIGAAPIAPAFDVQVADGPTVAAGVTYPSATEYVPITPGQYDVNIVSPGSSDVLLGISGWSIVPGAQSSVIIIEGLDGNLDVAPVVDAMAASAAPTGGIQTGYGGMAPDPATSVSDSLIDASVAVVVLLALAVVAWLVVLQRRWIGNSSR